MSRVQIERRFHPDATLPDYLASADVDDVRWWLVAALDSCREPATTPIGETWQRLGGTRVAGGGVLLPDATFREALDAPSIFCGFDEVWGFTQSIPGLTNCPTSIATDQPAMPVSPEFSRWLQEQQPTVGVGDGIGVNVITVTVEAAPA